MEYMGVVHATSRVRHVAILYDNEARRFHLWSRSPPLDRVSYRADAAGVKAYNPSQDLVTLASRLRNNGEKTLIAVAPAFEEPDVAPDDSLRPPTASEFALSEDAARRRSGSHPRGSSEGLDGRVARRKDAERLAAEEFSSWLIEELGGVDG